MTSRTALSLALLAAALVTTGVLVVRSGAGRAAQVDPGTSAVDLERPGELDSRLVAAGTPEPASTEQPTPLVEVQVEEPLVVTTPPAPLRQSRPNGLRPEDFMRDPRDSRQEPIDAEKVYELVQAGRVELASLTEDERAAYEVARQKLEGRTRPTRNRDDR